MTQTENRSPAYTAIIAGAGPAGLTAGYLLAKENQQVLILEADPQYVGGISRTVQYKGYRFDIGGHRFFSKSKEVEDFWTEILESDMLDRPRSSRIFYNGKFFSYPLKAAEALTKLGLLESTLCVLSYLKARIDPTPNPKSFEDWVSNQFGKRLFRIFFKTYTEKVWGMSCKEISADWAAQRIKGLSLGSAIWNALAPKRKPKSRTEIVKSLIDTFRYPRFGPGMMWERCAEKTAELGGEVKLGWRVTGMEWLAAEDCWRVQARSTTGEEQEFRGKHLLSTMPMRELAAQVRPALPAESLQAAGALRYRDFLTVALMLKDKNVFDDNWIYIHDPNVKVGRVQNYKSWSPEMVPDPAYTCYGLEYFCFDHDNLWNMKDSDLIELAKKELEHVGLGKATDVVDGCVVRQIKAYPVYDDHYAANVDKVREGVERTVKNLHFMGRNGMHKYNNQDHAMMTAMLTVRNILAGKDVYDIWGVNQDAQYHEAGSAGAESTSGLRDVPRRISA